MIKNEFKDDYTTRSAGERLRNQIISANTKITIDFEGIKVASASFFDEGIAKLGLEGWDAKRIQDSIDFKNMFKRDKELLISVCEIRNLTLKL